MMTFIDSIVAFFEVAIKFAPKFLPAVGLTLQLSFLSILLGTVFGLLVMLLKLTRLKVLEAITNVYISIVRGTPLLLQLYFIYFGLPKLGLEFDSFTSAVIGLAFHSGAYISEIFRGAINAVHYGQEEAGKAIGLNRFQIFYYIILPQAVKQAIPALGNQFIIAVKDSSLASVITITETMLIARQFVAATYNPFPILFVAGCYYYVIITFLSLGLRKIERRLKVNER
ncbi:amino acid ABC transporter permease [Fusibacter bizertensis]|jgi:amino acid ABC transporter membrane protein, PAAT family (TC 3.A.1.3.-)|uniref:Amino acid ABC transporter permease n=1 Tax=Fusibacter bizertensis TaxID=1488331 RepID=A0ABT6NCK1_9FIRM|nr:amino acid ABC transporter permease [Fusibacter bizertensis]MDH8678137.1 amino acid ABC transporter permease [Fusibacter bizertensis]